MRVYFDAQLLPMHELVRIQLSPLAQPALLLLRDAQAVSDGDPTRFCTALGWRDIYEEPTRTAFAVARMR